MFSIRRAAVLGLFVFALARPAPIRAEAPATAPTTARAQKLIDPKVLNLTVLAPNGKPLKTKVTVHYDGCDPSAKLMTDLQGKTQIEYPGVAPSLIVYVDGRKTEVPMRLMWSARSKNLDVPAEYTLQLEKSEPISGIVVDDAGTPIEGASVAINIRKKSDPTHSEQAVNLSFKTVKSGKDGKWSYPRAPAEFDRIDLGVFDARYTSESGRNAGFYPINKYEAVASLRDGSAKLSLKRGPMIQGQVFGPDGKPVAGAGVGAGQDRVASNVIPEIKTDAEGKFAMAASADEDVYLTVKAKGFAPDLLQFPMPADGKTVRFDLKPAAVLTGRVVAPDGKPIPAAFVWIDTWRGARTITTTIRTDAEGKFSWAGAPADVVYADVEGKGFSRQNKVALKSGDVNEIQLIAPATITGTVVDAETGRPIPKFKLINGISFDDKRPISWQSRRDSFQGNNEGKDGKYETTITYPYPGHALRIEADGYLPAETPLFKIADGNQTFDLKLTKSAGVTGKVIDAEGKAVSGVEVILVLPGGTAQFENGKMSEYVHEEQPSTTTAADGSFSLPAQTGEYVLVAFSDAGYADTQKSLDPERSEEEQEKPATTQSVADAGKPFELTLQRWGKINGVAMIGTKPAPRAKIQTFGRDVYRSNGPRVFHQFTATTDDAGRFSIPRVKPGALQVGLVIDLGNQSSSTTQAQKVDVRAGETVDVRLGGRGRPVVGKLDLPASLTDSKAKPWLIQQAFFSTKMDQKAPPVPAELKTNPEAMRAWYTKWVTSDEGKAFAAAMKTAQESQRHYPVRVEPRDGTFRVDDVAPGTYAFHASIAERPQGGNGFFGGEEIAAVTGEFTVAEVPGNGVTDEPMQLPAFPVKKLANLKVGDAAPAWDAKTLDGKPLKLSDFKGKYVVLDFWATWCGPCVAEVPNLKSAYAAYAADPRFAMVALSLDPDVEAPKKYAEQNELKWVQGFLGDWSKTGVPESYGVRGIPSTWLIGPDGTVLAKNLRGDRLESTLKQALGTTTKPAAK